ncbi:MFS transporter [Actinocorallia herbida]|uniref:MFS transporter n=1 Tax=Actinocorallia herbida TaxID=58109 RepID=A0A3N1D2J6_9ACTN|nr:MFS transporter [Actinocorallia herbida]ROO87753.1 MFS transporter [Actinocorallia herbida]
MSSNPGAVDSAVLPAPRPPAPAGGLRASLLLLSVAAVSYSLVQSVVNPGLEALRDHVHTSQLGVGWVLTGFLLASAVLTPVLGRVGDQIGKDRVLVAVLALLALGSVIGALATSLPVLVTGRVLQGAGGATLPLAFGLVRDLVPRHKVGMAVGTIAAVSSVGGALGVLAAGPIVSALGVPWLFWLPALANALVAIAVFALLPPSRGATAGGQLNVGAIVTLAGTLVLLLLPLSLGQEWGWGSGRTLGLLAGALAVGTLWIWWEHRSRHPLIDMRVFRMRPVWTANLASFLFGFTLYSVFGFVPSFLQVPTLTGYGLGQSITVAGLIFLPVTLTQFASGIMTGPLAARIPAKILLIVGSLPVMASLLLLAAFHEAPWQISLLLAVAGIGFGVALSALSALVVHAVPAEHTGAVSGMNANIRTIGGAVGAAVVTTVLASTTRAGGFPSEGGWVAVFLLLAGAGLVGLASCLLIPDSSQGPHRREARTAAV